jgi:general secretion pathway protein G
MKKSRRKNGFTLIEILVVLVIIMILAGIIIAAAKYAQTKAARSRAQAEIATMETALESYKNDNGIYPATQPGRPTANPTAPLYENSAVLYTALTTPKVYMTFKPNQIVVNGVVTYIVDPFGNPYRYYCPQPAQPDQTNSATFDLWSCGPDGKNDEGTNDDIANWKQ